MHDAANNLTRMVEPGGSSTCTTASTGTVTGCIAFAYDSNDRRTVTRYPGGATFTATYDVDGNETSAVGRDSTSNDVVTNLTYCYQDLVSGACPTSGGTARSQITQQIQNDFSTGGVNEVRNYLYDGSGRLCARSSGTGGTCVSPPSGANKYTYDPVGNRTQATIGAVATYYAYNAADQLCYSSTSAGTCS